MAQFAHDVAEVAGDSTLALDLRVGKQPQDNFFKILSRAITEQQHGWKSN